MSDICSLYLAVSLGAGLEEWLASKGKGEGNLQALIGALLSAVSWPFLLGMNIVHTRDTQVKKDKMLRAWRKASHASRPS